MIENIAARSRLTRILVGVLLLASATEFVLRGPVRLLRQGMTWNDFLSPYIQARAWTHGNDPYSPQSLLAFWPADNQRPTWVDTEAMAGTLERSRGMPSPYPLPSLAILSVFTVLPWYIALTFWTVLSTAAVLLAALALVSACDCDLTAQRSQIFVAATLALAPLHTGLATANPAILAVSLAVLSFWAALRKRRNLAGLLLAIAVCLKPTVAGGLLAYHLVRRRWRIAGITCLVVALVTSIAAVRMAWVGVHWWISYAENARRMFASGSIDDFAQSDRLRFDMIHVQIVLGNFLSNAVVVNAISRLFALGLFVVWCWRCFQRQTQTGILESSAVLVLSMVAVYHRFYDAALLVWPLAWSILLVRKTWVTVLTIVVMAPFFVPGQAMLAEWTRSGEISSAVTKAWWWNGLILPHEVWLLIILNVLLLTWMKGNVLESDTAGMPRNEPIR